jgi:hypothetical protein
MIREEVLGIAAPREYNINGLLRLEEKMSKFIIIK